MEPYSKNSKQGMAQVGYMYGKQNMMGMQCMCPMMNMQGMCPMMNMKGMCPMMNMQSMCPMMNMQSMDPMMDMQSMDPMMDMQGMNPMMDMQGMNPMMDMQFPIPMLVKSQQISPNQIQICYDRDVDVMLGMKPTNYWIQDTMNVRPEGIATLGRNDKVNSRNSLTRKMVNIKSANGSTRTFILTFNQDITSGAQYKVIICYVTVKGAPPYSGNNGMATFIGK